MKHVMWLRQDVRMADNIALSQACQSPHEGVIALYVLTPKTWQNHHWAPVKVDLLLRQLACLSQDLATCNIPLKILTVPTFADVPDALVTFCQEHDIGQVFANQQYLVDEMHRDQQVEQVLQKQDVTCQWFHDAVLMPPQAVLKKEIHNPSSAMRKHCGYPEPIVDYSAMRQKVIATFKALPK